MTWRAALLGTTDRIRDLQTILAREGWAHGIRRSLREVVPPLFRRTDYVFVAADVNDVRIGSSGDFRGTVRTATSSDLPRFGNIATPSQMRQHATRFSRRQVCLIAIEGDRLAGYCWGTQHVDPILEGLPVTLAPGDILIAYLFVAEEFRKRGVAHRLLEALKQYGENRKLRRTVGTVDALNYASRALLEATGHREIGRGTYRRILWHRSFRMLEDGS